ncbi:uncharacterized protein B0I36DRAFT_242534 [Microdochium trichocladiopsis]|uniref:Uncharacterized protein n=1 Tax=Microdochium trichocladiopsis TaxID=1682393 RepID=A0A9P9BNB7_9PEZI|nr:uncharacterized protein B0I36DRAFT_242534 [Microdochium trichocladiopsis]KAH7031096.1 hypothetical protein B0I36DRAFT_242534 [Microdochium trichocladiopsis]
MAANSTTPATVSDVPPADSSSPPPPSATTSLQAAATMNAGLQQELSRRSSNGSISRQRQSPFSGRRRSTVLMNLQHNDPSLPAPGEIVSEERSGRSPQLMSGSPLLVGGDPHHSRAPSLGELHQELEAEQEAQVNRLLQMIRQQQLELQRLQASQGQTVSSIAAEDPLPAPERPNVAVVSQSPQQISAASTPRSPITPHHRGSLDLARDALRRRSRTPSRGAPSPRLRSSSISNEGGDLLPMGTRDETAFYQAETSSLIRENQMLRHRIRELERQLSEASINSPTTTHEPTQPSQLLQSTSIAEGENSSQATGTGNLTSTLPHRAVESSDSTPK